MRMKVDVAVRRHGCVARLERPPLAFDEAYLRIINCVAEDRAGGRDLAGRKGSAFHALRELAFCAPLRHLQRFSGIARAAQKQLMEEAFP